jgi:hypothetical protein
MNINECCSLGYNNSANTKDKNKGIQVRVLELNC